MVKKNISVNFIILSFDKISIFYFCCNYIFYSEEIIENRSQQPTNA